MAIQPLRANAVKTARAKSARASPQASSPRPGPSPPNPLGANLTCLGAPPPKTLITPALFSHPPPRPPGEEGEVCLEEEARRVRCAHLGTDGAHSAPYKALSL